MTTPHNTHRHRSGEIPGWRIGGAHCTQILCPASSELLQVDPVPSAFAILWDNYDHSLTMVGKCIDSQIVVRFRRGIFSLGTWEETEQQQKPPFYTCPQLEKKLNTF